MSLIQRIDMQPGFLLRATPYRESSQIIDVLTQDHGRVALVARGIRRPKSRWRSTLRPFQPLRVSWSGRGSLYTLTAAEPTSRSFRINGSTLMGGFYINELLLALMERGDSHPELFVHYAAALAELESVENMEIALRRFEVALLAEIGYALVVERDVVSEEPLDKSKYYEYVIDRGPILADHRDSGALVFSGAELIAIARCRFDEELYLKSAKKLLRAMLHFYLDGRPLRTRQVMAAMRR